jgi:hypothetical protein
MAKKQQFYNRYGVEEYYLYDPDRHDLTGFQRVNGQLEVIEEMAGWTSPRLGIVFTLTETDLELYYPDGRRFLTTVEFAQRAEQEKQRAQQEKQRADRLAAQLRALGVEPEE